MNPNLAQRLAGKSTPSNEARSWPNDLPLGRLGSAPFTLRDACGGVVVFGETGSGKSSGPLKTLRRKYVESGFGGLVLCVKPEESEDWLKCARAAGREQDVIRITADPDCPYRFDFLAWEMSLPGSSTLSMAHSVQNVLDILLRWRDGDPFKEAFRSGPGFRVLKHAIELYKLAAIWGPILKDQGHLPADEWVPAYQSTFLSVLEVITSAAVNAEDLESPSAIARSLNLKCLRLARKVAEFHAASGSKQSAEIVSTFNRTYDFWTQEWVQNGFGDPGIRKEFVDFAQSAIEPMERGEVANLFQRVQQPNPGGGQAQYVDTVRPDMVDQGKIILVDVPVNYYWEAGELAGVIWKHAVQQFAQLRTGCVEDSVRPVFIWLDDCGHFITNGDVLFQATARSQRILVVCAMQSVATLDQALGKDRRLALLSNLTTRIFCRNHDPVTNQWAYDTYDTPRWEWLATGGPQHKCQVAAYVCGNLFSGRKTWEKVVFNQN